MKRILFLSLLFLAWGVTFAGNATRTITGEVEDEQGEPLVGATVKVENELIAASTDIDGKFSLNIPVDQDVELSVTYVGYSPRLIKVEPSQTFLKVKLQVNASEIEEVVVIGYGTAKKANLTSSVEVLKGSDLAKIPSMNLDQSLAGQVSGLGVTMTSADPSSAKESRISVRGNTGEPLLVIDGIPRLGTTTNDGEMRLSDLNPDDIESISILKDAAAAAVYGARAANGVILVQTKRGKTSSRARVTYRGQFNFEQATNLPKFLKARQFAELYNRAVAESASDTYTPYDLDLIGSDPNLYGDENIMDHLKKWGHSQRHSISISGGGNAVRYFLSGAYSESKGLYSNIGRSRYNYSGKIDADILPGLTASVDFNGSVSNYKNSSYATLEEAYSYSPLQVLRFTDGSLASIEGYNPLIDIEGLGGYTKQSSDFHTVMGVLRYDIPFVKGLNIYLQGSIDFNNNNTTISSNPVTLYIYDERTGTFSIDENTVYPKANITMSDRFQKVNNKLIEFGINYNHTFKEKHDVAATAVFNYQDYHNRYLNGTNNNRPGLYPDVMGSTSSGSLTGNEYYTQRASVVGRATYGFANRYFAEFSFRVDGSTRFAPGKRWGFFPTGSVSWVISNESFFHSIPPNVLSFAKIRASAGILGDDGAISDYAYLQNYNYTNGEGYNFGGVWSPTLIPSISGFPNPDLTWGKSKDFNVGLDGGFWDNRISFSLEWFQRTRTDMVTNARPQLFPPSVGTGGVSANVNIGKVRYRGWDFSIRHVNNVGEFRYNVNFNIGTNDDIVLDWGDESSLPENQRYAGNPYSVWFLYEAAGLFQNEEEIKNWPLDQDGNKNRTLKPGDIKYVDQDGDGKLTVNDMINVKNSSLPDVSYGFGLGAEWKGIYFNAQFMGFGGYNQKITELYTLENGSLQRFQDYHWYDSWTPENPDAKYPRIKFATTGDNNRFDSTFWIKKCNFLRFKALTVGYHFPAKVLGHSGVKTLDIAFQASNLFTWSSLENGMDPEVLRGYPITRGYGVSLTFGF
ncbi:MAG: TonB-dependent receptor [Muribaculaceae bacterium]|nr:TonB-dependent receptor [Muribaculaceae bacterium]